MNKNQTEIVALCYDFDKTLSPRDMQEYGFIEKLSMTPDAFWAKSTKLVQETNMDDILAYMYLMVSETAKQGRAVTRSDLNALGKDIELFPGVAEWFALANEAGKEFGLEVEHYVISSGQKEIIEGTSIAKNFKEIYASSFHYDETGKAVWPNQAVNYTTKTQYLFRINKNISVGDVNIYIPEDERRVPFSRMVYIGDSVTDIPCMRLVKTNGGHAIAVYNNENNHALDTVLRLKREGRINYYAPADYSKNGEIYKIIRQIFSQIQARFN